MTEDDFNSVFDSVARRLSFEINIPSMEPKDIYQETWVILLENKDKLARGSNEKQAGAFFYILARRRLLNIIRSITNKSIPLSDVDVEFVCQVYMQEKDVDFDEWVASAPPDIQRLLKMVFDSSRLSTLDRQRLRDYFTKTYKTD